MSTILQHDFINSAMADLTFTPIKTAVSDDFLRHKRTESSISN